VAERLADRPLTATGIGVEIVGGQPGEKAVELPPRGRRGRDAAGGGRSIDAAFGLGSRDVRGGFLERLADAVEAVADIRVLASP